MRELLPHDEDAERLRAQVITLAEALTRHSPRAWRPRRGNTRAVVQTHCHQHAVLGFDADAEAMRRAGIDANVLDAGCGGLAGNFGFERGHYEVSMACAEHALLPAIRRTGEQTPILADGFSRRTRIAHGSDRQALHLAQPSTHAERGIRL